MLRLGGLLALGAAGLVALGYSKRAGASIAPSSAASVGQAVRYKAPRAALPYLEAIEEAEVKYALPSGLLLRTIDQESHFRPEIIDGRVRSSSGALGIAQFMPATAADRGIDPLEPYQAIDAAGAYLSELYMQFGSWSLALAAYNWGPGNVARRGIGAAPAETRAYVSAILADVRGIT